MDWIATIMTTLIGALAGVDPLVFLSLIVIGLFGYGWIKATERFDALAARHDAVVDALNNQVADLNRDYSTANKDTAEIVNQVAQTLSTLAANLKVGGNPKGGTPRG